MQPHKKTLLMNTGLLLGVAVLLFRLYLPLTEEIADLNQQMKSAETQFNSLKAEMKDSEHTSGDANRRVYALPEAEMAHLGRQLENLSAKHSAKLINLETDSEKTQTVSRLKLKLVPYEMAFSAKSAEHFASLLADLENQFPEIIIKGLDYKKEIVTIDAILFTSPQDVRLFTP